MLKISKLADYATQIMPVLMQQATSMSAATIAKKTMISGPTVAKVLKKLTEAGLLQSTQGVKGGYQLTSTPEKISLSTIITAMDGQPAMTECCKKNYDCAQESVCVLRDNWQSINRIVLTVLDSISLHDMARTISSQSKKCLKKGACV